MTLRVRAEVYAAVLAHARRDAPDECCGLLLGDDEVLDEARPARNLTRSPNRYLIDPEDHFAAIRRARETGRRVRAVYHSHPAGPAAPSSVDAADVRDAELVYVIVSLADTPVAAAWRWTAGTFEEIPIVTVR